MAGIRQILTLIFSDSRGKNLDVYLDREDILVKAYKGAPLLRIVELSTPIINQYNPTCVIYIGGTCDLTVMDRNTRIISPRVSNFPDLCAYMMNTFKEARRISNERFPGTMVLFGGLCGVNLNMYNCLPFYDNLQPVIDQTIDVLNYAIKADNLNHGLIHPVLTRKVHRKEKKGARNQYHLLSDGVHLSELLYIDWAKNLTRVHCNLHNLPK